VYICPRKSYTGFHKEDFNLQSANLLHAGAPNVWILVPPRHTDQLEARITELYKLTDIKCSQFVRHQNVIIPPALLKLWKVAFKTILQFPGQVVITDYGAYHYVWHTGPNLSEAVNLCEGTWLPPPLYQCYASSLVCGEGPFVSHNKMRMIGLKKLKVEPTHVPVHMTETVLGFSHHQMRMGESKKLRVKPILPVHKTQPNAGDDPPSNGPSSASDDQSNEPSNAGDDLPPNEPSSADDDPLSNEPSNAGDDPPSKEPSNAGDDPPSKEPSNAGDDPPSKLATVMSEGLEVLNEDHLHPTIISDPQKFVPVAVKSSCAGATVQSASQVTTDNADVERRRRRGLYALERLR
jgi:JmjC domain, hydroxylase